MERARVNSRLRKPLMSGLLFWGIVEKAAVWILLAAAMIGYAVLGGTTVRPVRVANNATVRAAQAAH